MLYFEGIARVEPVLNTLAGSFSAAGLVLLFGAAAHEFIFAPTTTSAAVITDDSLAKFDPASASLGETLRWNLFGYTARGKVAIIRTGLLALLTWINTFLQTSLTVNGVETSGAAAYASVWTLSAVLAGVALEIVGRV